MRQRFKGLSLSISNSKASIAQLELFLGGRDLEMQSIAALARDVGVNVHDDGLSWGAQASHYAQRIAEAQAAGHTPVLVELPWDLSYPSEGVLLIDHHGERAGIGEPSSLRQIFDLLHLPAEQWTRELSLIEANDIGWIPAMLRLGATTEEVCTIRAADRASQGVTDNEELQAEQAVAQLRLVADGQLAIVHCPHDRSAPITDRLHSATGGQSVDNVLIQGPSETQFFGRGDLLRGLHAEYPGGWYGGALPERGYWGHARLSEINPVILQLCKQLAA